MASTSSEAAVLVPSEAMGRRIRFRWREKGRVVEVSLVITWTAKWQAREESRSPLWSAHSFGPLTFAVRFPVEFGDGPATLDDAAEIAPMPPTL